MRRFVTAISKTRSVPTVWAMTSRDLHYPLSPAPFPIKYLDSDPLEFVLRQEARNFGLDDFEYSRELAFVRINDNPSVGYFKGLSSADRAKLFYGSTRQDFYTYLVFKLTGQVEHLYHFR